MCIGAVAEVCGALLPTADDVRVLATSREPVGIAGEARYRVPPLTVPEPDNPADVGPSEAVALFADRARQADPHFALDGETGPVVARLVARLDGMPLAIELAAARVESLGVAQLLERLDDRFALLAGGDRLAAARHRSLAATVEWSYQILSEQEQRVFRQLAIFPGPFTLEAAETVAGPAAGPAVLHLVDCSLLVPPRTGRDGRARYLMLETLRAYGLDRLAEAGEQPGAAAALARHALYVAEQAAAGLQASAGELDAARWLDAEDASHAAGPRLGAGTRPADCAARGGGPVPVVAAAGPLGGRVHAAARRRGMRDQGRGRKASRAALARPSGRTHVRPCLWRSAISPRSVTLLPSVGRRPSWLMAWQAGRGSCGTSAGYPRRPRLPTVPWPWPGNSATRRARRWR